MPAAVLAALEVSERLKDYGSYAGVASIIGLAVLSLLYFGQARELKRLREWAGREPERAAEREAAGSANAQRVVPQPAAARPAAPAAPAAAGAPAAAQPRPRAAVPATAAGAVAATAATAAPAVKPGEVPGAGAPSAVPGSPGGDPPKPPSATPTPTPAPASANGGQETSEDDAAKPDLPAAATPAPPRPRTVQIPSPQTGGTGPRTPAGAASVRRRLEEPEPANHRRTLGIVGGVLAALVAAVLLVTVVFGGDDAPNEAANTIADPAETVPLPQEGSTRTTTTGSGGAAVARGDVVVAVLNGTTSNGLAREAMDKLATEGYREGTTDNAPDRTLVTTKIAYAEGFRRAALDVAKALGVQPANVAALDRSTQVVAGEDAKVVVTLGADKA